MAYKHSTPSSFGLDGRKAGKCISLVTGAVVTRQELGVIKKVEGSLLRSNNRPTLGLRYK